jgi:type VI protein secretion system component Hcp
MSLILKIDGISGEATGKGIEGGIQLHHMKNSSVRPVVQRVGIDSHDIGMMHMDHIVITKNHDQASIKLAQHLLLGKSIPKAEITQYNLTSGYPEWKYKLTLSNVRVVSIDDISDSHGGYEQMTLAFSKIEKSYRSQSSSGSYKTPQHTGFDLPTAATC